MQSQRTVVDELLYSSSSSHNQNITKSSSTLNSNHKIDKSSSFFVVVASYSKLFIVCCFCVSYVWYTLYTFVQSNTSFHSHTSYTSLVSFPFSSIIQSTKLRHFNSFYYFSLSVSSNRSRIFLSFLHRRWIEIESSFCTYRIRCLTKTMQFFFPRI